MKRAIYCFWTNDVCKCVLLKLGARARHASHLRDDIIEVPVDQRTAVMVSGQYEACVSVDAAVGQVTSLPWLLKTRE